MFAFVWYEQGTMLSKGRLRPADAREVVERAGGGPNDPIALIAVHDDADAKYADCKGIGVADGEFHVFEDLIIDADDRELGRLPRLPEGAHELRDEETRALWERVTNASVQFLSDAPADELSETAQEAIRKALSQAQLESRQIDPFHVLIAYFSLTESSATHLRQLLDQQSGAGKVEQLITKDALVNPFRDFTHENAEWSSRLVATAKRIHDAVSSPQTRVGSRHILASLLLRDAPELSIAPQLEVNGYDVDALRASFARYLSTQYLKEPLWLEVLTGRSGFDLANRATTDIWTRDDTLGYAKYAQAIADSILLGNAPPPLTVGIQAPWGQGKTSLMRMIQARLDPASVERERLPRTANPRATASVVTTYGELLAWMRDPERIRRFVGAFGARVSAWLERQLVKHSDTFDGMLQPAAGTIPSVWFNPLYYRETSQVWAGLAHAILHQLVEQLPTATQREEFWLRLQVSRINVAAVRRDIHLWLLTRAIPWVLFWIGAALAFIFVPNLSDLTRVLGSGGSVFAAALTLWRIFEKRTVDRPFEKYVSEPAYQTELGLLHLVDHDLDRALRLLVRDRPVAVFIDDLDRCDPQTVKQVVLAINQFLSLPNRNVYFFLGMDMEMVAASLEEAQQPTQHPGRRQGFGWRFMEKFIQLPFVIPHLDPKTARTFAAGHLRGMAPTAPVKTIDVEEKLAAIDRATAATEVGRIAREIAQNSEIAPAVRARLEERFSRRTTQLMQDPESEEVQKIVEIAIDDLDLNPRTIKRYFSLVRVLRNIQIATGAVSNADHDRKIVLRAAHLLLNWPQFVQWLRNTPELPASGAKTIDEIHRAATSTDWSGELEKILGEKPPTYLADPALHRFLGRIATDGPGIQELYEGGMF
jgi:hypothetical protein